MKATEVKNIFISMGTPYTDDQRAFQNELISLIEENQMVARIINRTDYPTGNPLVKIKSVLAECDGAIIVAYERTYFKEGIEKRLSEIAKKPLDETKYTTPWNQIEAAMGYALGMPIFVLMENKLRAEGLLEEKYEWYIERLEITPSALQTGESRKRVAQWLKEVFNTKSKPFASSRLAGETTLAEIIQSLPIKVVWQILGAIALIFSAGIGLSHLLK